MEAKVCSVKGDITASRSVWKLVTADGTPCEPTFVTGGPKPEFVDDSRLAPGDCVIGNIMFVVPWDTRPATALYAPPTLDETKGGLVRQ
ncbi:hypothetical protein ACFYUJ_37585 [Streptomyces sp. NPDC004520]|uniref:hypothetical protein n=1 Tax=Streptomyces sp. NPDC004520 TaxID=3364702 RepID=UPI0036ACD25F